MLAVAVDSTVAAAAAGVVVVVVVVVAVDRVWHWEWVRMGYFDLEGNLSFGRSAFLHADGS